MKKVVTKPLNMLLFGSNNVTSLFIKNLLANPVCSNLFNAIHLVEIKNKSHVFAVSALDHFQIITRWTHCNNIIKQSYEYGGYDIAIDAGFDHYFPPEIRTHFPLGLWRLHPALLRRQPNYNAIHNVVFLNDSDIAGITVLKLEGDGDLEGRILYEEYIRNHNSVDEYIEQVCSKMADSVYHLLSKPVIKGEYIDIKLKDDLKLSNCIDVRMHTLKEIENLCRVYNDVHTYVGGEKLILNGVTPFKPYKYNTDVLDGEVIQFSKKKIYIKCRDKIIVNKFSFSNKLQPNTKYYCTTK